MKCIIVNHSGSALKEKIAVGLGVRCFASHFSPVFSFPSPEKMAVVLADLFPLKHIHVENETLFTSLSIIPIFLFIFSFVLLRPGSDAELFMSRT